MPPKKLSGTEMTRAHGQLTTRNVRPRRIQSLQAPMPRSGGSTASSKAAPVTVGVYQRAKRVMKFSVFAFFSLAFSTSSRMRLTVDSPKGLVVRTCRRPVMLMQPETTSAPVSTWRGTLSPVRAEVSSWLAPSVTTPSMGMRSPGFTTMMEPTSTSSGSTCARSPARSMLA